VNLPASATVAHAAILTVSAANGIAESGGTAPGRSSSEGSGTPLTQQARGDFEGLFSRDIQMTQTTASYGVKRGGWEFDASAAFNTYDLDYEPVSFDFLGFPESVAEVRWAAALQGKVELRPSLTLSATGGFYDGYNDYRSIWLNEYFRQQYSALPGYLEATPGGEQVSADLRWEYLPASGYVQVGLDYFHDEIAPGYEIDFDGLRRGRANLYTTAYRIAFENVVTRRARLLNEFRLADTTDRELRYSVQSSLNLALGEPWVIRIYGGYAEEEPTFQSWYAGGSVEYEAGGGWHVGVLGRFYHDTGEIENSLFSTAAPGVEAWQIGIGVRRVWGRQALKVYAAPYFTRYDPVGIGTAFFQHLYEDRDWAVVQFAYSIEF
jgi:hypothetical protein